MLICTTPYSSTGATDLLEHEKQKVVNALPKVSSHSHSSVQQYSAPPFFQPFSEDDLNVLFDVLGQVHIPGDDDDLHAKEDLKVCISHPPSPHPTPPL